MRRKKENVRTLIKIPLLIPRNLTWKFYYLLETLLLHHLFGLGFKRVRVPLSDYKKFKVGILSQLFQPSRRLHYLEYPLALLQASHKKNLQF